jgi:beta-glucosidase
VYASRTESAVERPPRWLVGFATVDAGPGENVVAEVRLPGRSFAHWDTAGHAWVVEPGAVTLEVGRSSRDLRGAATVKLRD